jgi:hypothetical protein
MATVAMFCRNPEAVWEWYLGGGLMFDIDAADNPFAGLAMQSDRGIFIRRASGEALVALERAFASVKPNL